MRVTRDNGGRNWPWVIATVFSQPNAYRLVERLLLGLAVLVYTCAMAFCGRP